jgi:CheY-like chemotaxis protein
MVLIVDDDALVRNLVALELEGMGLSNTILAANGGEALRLLEREEIRPDLIIAERSMPETDGLRLLRACKKDRRLRDIPFIMMDGEGGSEARIMEAIEAGAGAYLAKPFFPDDLQAALEKVGVRGSQASISDRD